MSSTTIQTERHQAALRPEFMSRYSFGYGPPLLLDAGVHFGVFAKLEHGPKTAEQLSAEAGASVRGMRALLNGLVGMEVLAKDGGAYDLTPQARAFLLPNSPAYFGGLIQHTCRRVMENWLHMKDAVRTGLPVARREQEADGAAYFESWVTELFAPNYPAAEVLAKSLLRNWTGSYRVLDLGAGSGVWGLAFARQSPDAQVTAVDWPAVLTVTRKVAARLGTADQLSVVEGDIRTVEYGTGYQAVTLGHILHMIGEAGSRELLKKSFAALAPGGTVAIAEWLVNADRTAPLNGLVFAMNMVLHTTEGDTFSFNEIAEWLRDAGFGDIRLMEAPAPCPLVLATKPAPANGKGR